MEIIYTFRKGSKLADYFSNHFFYFTEIDIIKYISITKVPKEGKVSLSMEKDQIPNISIA